LEYELSITKKAIIIKEKGKEPYLKIKQSLPTKEEIDLPFRIAIFILINQHKIIKQMEEQETGTLLKDDELSMSLVVSTWWNEMADYFDTTSMLALCQNSTIMKLTSMLIQKLCGIIKLLQDDVFSFHR
jgi:hypothetical protein